MNLAMATTYFTALLSFIYELDTNLGAGATGRFAGAFNESIMAYVDGATSAEAKSSLLRIHQIAIDGMATGIDFSDLNKSIMAYYVGE